MANEIFTKVSEFVNTAVSATAAAAVYDFNPPPITLPAVDFIADLTGTAPTLSLSGAAGAVPTASVTGSLSAASYSAVSSVLNGLSLRSIPESLNYQNSVNPSNLPNYTAPAAPKTHPEAPFFEVAASAGIKTVPSPTIVVGTPPPLEPIPRLNSYEEQGFYQLDVVVPTPAEVPTVDQLQNPNALVVMLDADLRAAITKTLGGQDFMLIQGDLYNMDSQDTYWQRVDDIREAFSDSAARGFSETNGPVFEVVADINYKAALEDGKAYEKGRDFIYDAAKRKLVEAVQQMIVLETANFSVHMAYASKLVEVFEINATLHNQLFNTVLDMYSLQIQGVNAIIDSYNTYVGVVVAEQKAKTADLGAVRAQLKTNKALISMYEAQGKTEAVRADVFEVDVQKSTIPLSEYSIYIDGLLQNIDIQKVNIQAYKDALSSYGIALKVDKAAIDAYSSQLRASGSAVDVYKANWDLYGAANSALSGQNSAVGEYNRASLQALTSEIGVFQAAADEQSAYLRAVGVWIEQNKSISSDYTRAVSGMVSYSAGKNRSAVAMDDAKTRIDMAKADFKTTEEALDAQREAAQATIDAGLLASEATSSAGLASAAYAIRSISADINSTASDSTSRSFTSSASEGNSYSKTYRYTHDGS